MFVLPTRSYETFSFLLFTTREHISKKIVNSFSYNNELKLNWCSKSAQFLNLLPNRSIHIFEHHIPPVYFSTLFPHP